jgi:DNA-directed RNA polymerase specialized sigma24 family protein
MEEAAAAMGCAAGTVKSLLFSARERLRTQLGDDES